MLFSILLFFVSIEGLRFVKLALGCSSAHWRNLGRDFYFLFGIWSVCVCSKGFRLEEPIEPTASPRVEAVRDSIQGHRIYSCAPPRHRFLCSAEPYPWMWIQSRTTKLCGARCEFDALVRACNSVFMLLARTLLLHRVVAEARRAVVMEGAPDHVKHRLCAENNTRGQLMFQ